MLVLHQMLHTAYCTIIHSQYACSSFNTLNCSFVRNFVRSGTVNVADVDGYYDPVLDSFGEIGINLRGNLPASPCILWVLGQYFLGRGRIGCSTSCAPSYYEARVALRSRWYRLTRRTKYSAIYPYYSICVFSRYRWYQSATECCYHPFFGFLIDFPIPGAGRSHQYHPRYYRYFYPSLYQQEETAYGSCCLSGNNNLCQLFYSLRPPCSAYRWWQSRSRWGELIRLLAWKYCLTSELQYHIKISQCNICTR